MDNTLEILPGEGTVETITRTRMRHKCDVCGESAHYKHTFLLENARNNRASSAYGHDDCTWCEDERRYVCAKHQTDCSAPDGYSLCSTFPASEVFAHMFLYWSESK